MRNRIVNKLAAITAITTTITLGCITVQLPPAPEQRTNDSAVITFEGINDSVGVVQFSGAVGIGSDELLASILDNLRRDNRVKTIQVRIDSPGGYVHVGRAIAASIQAASFSKPVECVVYGKAASAAYFILQSCPVRKMNWDANLMIHRAVVDVGVVNAYEAVDAAMRLEMMDVELSKINCGRLHITLDECRKLYSDRDYWMNSVEAFQLGAVDEVVLP